MPLPLDVSKKTFYYILVPKDTIEVDIEIKKEIECNKGEKSSLPLDIG